MTNHQKTPTPNTPASGSVAAPPTPAGGQVGPRSGLTGHLRPTFWRMRPRTAPPVQIGAPTARGAPALARPKGTSAALGRWWQDQVQRNQAIHRATLLVMACTLVSLGIYVYGTARFPLGPNLALGHYEDIGQLTDIPDGSYNPVAAELFLFAIVLLFGAWGLVSWLAGLVEKQAKAGWRRTPLLLSVPLFGFPVIALLVLLFMYPITAVDVFDYASQIRVLTIYHANPLTTPPNAFPHDPFLPFNPWREVPASYGPLWALLSALFSLPAGNNFFAAVLAQKLLSLVAGLGCMGLVWLLARRLCPERRWQAFVFFAWNPLVLFEVGANGHNDSVMICFLLAGLLALLSPRWYWQALALPLLVASVLVKWTSILLLPLVIVYLLRGGRARRWGLVPLSLGTLLTAVYAIPLIAPFLDSQNTPGVLLQSTLLTTSPPALLHSLLQPIYLDPVASAIVRLLGLGSFALVYLFILARFAFPGPDERLGPGASYTPPQRLLMAGLESYFWYFVLATFWFQPWYLLALLPLAALDPRPLARVRAALFSLGAPLKYLVYIFILVIYWWHSPSFTTDLTACLAVYGLALFTRLLESWERRVQLYRLLARAQFPPTPTEEAPRRRKSWWLL